LANQLQKIKDELDGGLATATSELAKLAGDNRSLTFKLRQAELALKEKQVRFRRLRFVSIDS
jgi:hypothetical protein